MIPSTSCGSGSLRSSLSARCCGHIEFVDLGVGLGNLLLVAGSTSPSASLNVSLGRLRLYEYRLLLCSKILHLQSEQCKRCNSLESVVPAPVQNVMLLQLVRLPSDASHPSQGITLLYVVQCEESVVLSATVAEAEVNRRAITCGAEHRVHHDLGHVDLLPPWGWLVLLATSSRSSLSSSSGTSLI